MLPFPPVVRASLSLIATLAWSGCAEPSVFACSTDSECAHARAHGVCEDVGFCSFPDTDCSSGRRYGELAGHGLGARCVIPSSGGEGTEASSASTDTQPPVDTASTTSATFGTATDPDDTGHEWSDTGTSGSSADGTSSFSGSLPSTGGSSGGPIDGNGSTGGVDPCAYSIFDDFEDRAIDENWHQNTPQGTEVFEKDGQLELSLPPLPVSHLIVSRQLDQAMVGGYVRAHLTEIDDASGLASSGVFLSIGVCDLQLYAHGGMLRVHRWSDIDGNEQLYSEPLEPDFPQWLQVRQDEDGAVFFELSVDEVQWTVLFSAAFPECGDAFAPPKIGVFAGGHSFWSVVRRFESISVCAPAPESS